jgi:tripartite-type tricarboxylate transporter receptor subunit TctC
MKLPRRKFLQLAAGTAALPVVSRFASAQSYPSQRITMVVPFAAGAAAGTIARLVAEGMRPKLGQPIIIENAGGAEAASEPAALPMRRRTGTPFWPGL